MTHGVTSPSGKPLGRRPAGHVIAAFVLTLTGLCFAVAAAVLIYATQVNAPPVAQFFATVAVVLLATALLHFVAVGGIWLRRPWAALLGIFISFLVTAIAGYIGIDQLTHSDDALRVSAPYLATAFLYAVCLVSLTRSASGFNRA